jgi:hypothetical protein
MVAAIHSRYKMADYIIQQIQSLSSPDRLLSYLSVQDTVSGYTALHFTARWKSDGTCLLILGTLSFLYEEHPAG